MHGVLRARPDAESVLCVSEGLTGPSQQPYEIYFVIGPIFQVRKLSKK